MAEMMGPAPAAADLLDDVARHGFSQINASPTNPTGYWNMAWVFHQATNQANALSKAHRRLRECLERAETAGHDILICVASIELAGSIIFGAGRPHHTASWSVDEVGALLARFDAGTRDLDEWAMGAYSRGESACQDIVRHHVGLARKRGAASVPCLDRSAHFTLDNGSPGNFADITAMGTCSGCHLRFMEKTLKRCARCKDPRVLCKMSTLWDVLCSARFLPSGICSGWRTSFFSYILASVLCCRLWRGLPEIALEKGRPQASLCPGAKSEGRWRRRHHQRCRFFGSILGGITGPQHASRQHDTGPAIPTCCGCIGTGSIIRQGGRAARSALCEGTTR